MTDGQQQALRELRRIQTSSAGALRLEDQPVEANGNLGLLISVRLGPIRSVPGGLDLREREDFVIVIPEDFPFSRPWLRVLHERFAKFPHVVWAKSICLYQSELEWNPSDGMYGFLDRIGLWLSRAAANDMDPIDGPLEPPHYITDFSQRPYVVRADAPVSAGQRWIGFAETKVHSNRIEIVGWNDLTRAWSPGVTPALAVFLEGKLPPEFPQDGRSFLAELEKQGWGRFDVIRRLGFAASLSSEGEPIHLILGIPMRRSPLGVPKTHIAVWTTSADHARSLKLTLPRESDPDTLLESRADLAEALYRVFENTNIAWCHVLEDRPEIVVRRDSGTVTDWLRAGQRRVLVLGCGALGSWAAEFLARAAPKLIDLVDRPNRGTVSPGVLVRQNYRLEDIGASKAGALKSRLDSLTDAVEVRAWSVDALEFITQDKERFRTYDLVLDCTASGVLLMRLEKEWGNFDGLTPPMASLVVDAQCRHGIMVGIDRGSECGLLDASLQLRNRICLDGRFGEVVNSFYRPNSGEQLFQPEPGCSDPTFAGSALDVVRVTSIALHEALRILPTKQLPFGLLFDGGVARAGSGATYRIPVERHRRLPLGQYTVCFGGRIIVEMCAWIKQSGRVRGEDAETGGLLWGHWDSATRTVWILDVSGPPSDSVHSQTGFVCGSDGTIAEHRERKSRTAGLSGFLGYWHSHPNMPSSQSVTDIRSMAELVSRSGENQKQALMLIVGGKHVRRTIDFYAYEQRETFEDSELIVAGHSQVALPAEYL